MVVTVLDLAALRHPELFNRWNRTYSRLTVPRVVRAARRVIAISEFTKRELVELLGVDAGPRDRDRRPAARAVCRRTARAQTATTCSRSGRSSRARTWSARRRRRHAPAWSCASSAHAAGATSRRTASAGSARSATRSSRDCPGRARSRLPVALRGLRDPDPRGDVESARRSSRLAAARPRRSQAAPRCSSTRSTRPRSQRGSTTRPATRRAARAGSGARAVLLVGRRRAAANRRGVRGSAVIVVDADVLGRDRTGDETYVANLLQALADLKGDLRIGAITRRRVARPGRDRAVVLTAARRSCGWRGRCRDCSVGSSRASCTSSTRFRFAWPVRRCSPCRT